jgi:hypothetical protein
MFNYHRQRGADSRHCGAWRRASFAAAAGGYKRPSQELGVGLRGEGRVACPDHESAVDHNYRIH